MVRNLHLKVETHLMMLIASFLCKVAYEIEVATRVVIITKDQGFGKE